MEVLYATSSRKDTRSPMPSSLTTPRPVEPAAPLATPPLLDLLASVTDHRLPTLLAACLVAVATGAKSYAVIAEFIADAAVTILTELCIELRRRPSEATIRRTLNSVDVDLLDRVLGAWMWIATATAVVAGRRFIAIDGKTVRGARTPSDPTSKALHLVSALDHATGTVLGQLQISAKSNEIPARCCCKVGGRAAKTQFLIP